VQGVVFPHTDDLLPAVWVLVRVGLVCRGDQPSSSSGVCAGR
jgi:hypothetical protein